MGTFKGACTGILKGTGLELLARALPGVSLRRPVSNWMHRSSREVRALVNMLLSMVLTLGLQGLEWELLGQSHSVLRDGCCSADGL